MSATYIFATSIDVCINVLEKLNKKPDYKNGILSWIEDSRPDDGGNTGYAVELNIHDGLLHIDKGFTPYWNGQFLLCGYLDDFDKQLYLYST
mgnify:CR=1 FL=1